MDIEVLKEILKEIIDVLNYLNGETTEEYGAVRHQVYDEIKWISKLVENLDEERS